MPTIRLISETDVPAFRHALDSVARERLYLAAFEAPPIERVEAFISSNVKNGHPQFVAVEDGEIVGWCDAIPGASTAGTAHVGSLGMGVIKEYRGNGIGRQLLEATLSKAKELGLEKIELSVYASNESAIGLYEKLGFSEEGRKKKGRLADGIYDDVILMGLFLNERKMPAAEV